MTFYHRRLTSPYRLITCLIPPTETTSTDCDTMQMNKVAMYSCKSNSAIELLGYDNLESINFKNSFRVSIFSKVPRKPEVVVREFCFCTPRIIIHI